MNCERFRELLNAYIDDALTAEEMREFMVHADTCEDCRNELRTAEVLRDMMKDMDEDVAVPLQAQAAWRSAVRNAAKQQRIRRFSRIASAAAALLLVVGVGFMLDGQGTDQAESMPETAVVESAEVNGAALMIARDGSPQTVAASASDEAYAAMKKIETEDFDQVCMAIEQLCGEYSGKLTAELAEGERREISYRIEMPYEYMGDFLNASSRIGDEIDSQLDDAARETALILIRICEK